MLKVIEDKQIFKKKFTNKFRNILLDFPEFNEFIMNLFVYGTAYIVGGFLRDAINDKASRDLDMMVSVPHSTLESLLNHSKLKYSINRMLGIKINMKNFEVDIWSIDNNWAFRNSLIKRNDDYILDNISDGCFYNFDGLVINIHTNNFRCHHYNDFVRNKKLDIIQKNNFYKLKNPTVEANILRAVYLNTLYGVDITPNCMNYLIKMFRNVEMNYDLKDRLNFYLNKYSKYQNLLTIDDVMDSINIIKYIHRNRFNEPGQLNFEL